MGPFVCPGCGVPSEIFPAVTGGAAQMAKEMGIPFLGTIPLDPMLLRACEAGMSYQSWLEKEKIDLSKGSAVKPFADVVGKIMQSSPELLATFSGK